MRPRLATPDDVAALWEYLAVIDVFATDHAPHTLEEKMSEKPPPGVPGVETMLPLLLTAVHDGRLALDDVLARCLDNPRRIYALPPQPDTWVEVEVDTPYVLRNETQHTRVRWTPFAEKSVVGCVERVIIRGQLVYEQEIILAQPGSGKVLFAKS
jgi:carbamoyl-phosphate synthase/aspartate carbamoyltransferase/dihydroorotase